MSKNDQHSPYSHYAFIYGIAYIIIESGDTTFHVSASLCMYRSAKRRRGAFKIWIGSAPIRTLDMHIRPMDTVFGVRIGRRTHPFFGYAAPYL